MWKIYDSAGNNSVFHSGLSVPEARNLNFDSNVAEQTNTNIWGNTNPTSDLFYLSTTSWGTSVNMCGILWAAKPGYSAFGTAVGNGVEDGTVINVGIKPVSFRTKSFDATSDWWGGDNLRNGYNPDTYFNRYEDWGAETTDKPADILSNGIKWRMASADPNSSGETIIYSIFGTPTVNKSGTPAKAR
jgi:hypothetical protein